MTRKMLLVAVGDYQTHAPALVSAVPELDRWKGLLTSKYGLRLEAELKDSDADRDEILKHLDLLLKDARPDDQLLFLFIGHGTVLDESDEALIAFPKDGKDFRKAAIVYDDIARILKKRRPPAGTDITFIIESCFAGGFGAPGAQPLFIPPTTELNLNSVAIQAFDKIEGRTSRGRRDARSERETRGVRRFSDLASWQSIRGKTFGHEKGGSAVAAPVIVSASREDEAAYQVKSGYSDRMLFSLRAIDRLYESRDSFDAFENAINPLREGFEQYAAVYGSAERRAELFPGQRDAGAGPAAARVGSNGPSIRMRFFGLGCFIPPREPGVFGNRIVCPYDFVGTTPATQHTAFVEIPEDDIYRSDGPLTGDPHRRGTLWYRRISLTRHRVFVDNAVRPIGFERTDEFDLHVPRMDYLCPELTSPRDECFLNHPVQGLFTAFFDLSGKVDHDTLEKVKTKFVLEIGGGVTWGAENTPRSVTITLPFDGDQAVLVIDDSLNRDTTVIWIKPGATILAGNARPADIDGDGSGENPPEHFKIYYSLASPKPGNRAFPAIATVPVDACSVVRWP